MAKFKQSNKRNPTIAEGKLMVSIFRYMGSAFLSLAIQSYDKTKDRSIFYRLDISPAEMLDIKHYIEKMEAEYPKEFGYDTD